MAAPKLHSSNLIYFGVCALGMLAFTLVGIIPNTSASRQLDEEMVQLKQKVQVQELLYPIYAELIKQFQQKAPADLPLPQREKIQKNSLSDLNAKFAELARTSNVNFKNAIPDPISYQEETGRVTMNVTFSGDFFNFRKLLMNICKLTYLSSIEQMEVIVQGDVKHIQLKLVLDQE